jgi:hypothetical protein
VRDITSNRTVSVGSVESVESVETIVKEQSSPV